tara:strand:- start:2725 stop:2943 length:219 start_codon:yes stop_codon:yes gene_type:complete
MAMKTQAEMIGLYAGLLVRKSMDYEDAIIGQRETTCAELHEQELEIRSLCSQLRNLVAELVLSGMNLEGNDN